LKNPSAWSPEFVKFVNYCLNKDPFSRPNAELALKYNEEFFRKTKDKKYLAETLLKGVPTVQDRYARIKSRDEIEDKQDDEDLVK
jgi:serine/threonine protein kinase